MNKENIKKLIETLKGVKYTSDYVYAKSGFNMEVYSHECGTPSCMAGYAASEAIGYKNYKIITEDQGNGDFSHPLAQNWLGLTEDQALILFLPNESDDWNMFDIKPKHAIKALEIILKEGKVKSNIWDTVMENRS